MNWQFDTMHGFMGGGMWLFWLFLLVVIVVLFKYLLNEKKAPESPLDILKRRYASGEITQEQYETQKKVLLS